MTEFADLRDHIAALLAQVDTAGTIRAIEPCSSGHNNRTYRVVTDNRVLAAKQYFRHEGDGRDRLAAEFAFLDHAVRAAPGRVPAPLAMDQKDGFALYEFVDGRTFRPGEIGWEQVYAAADFFSALNAEPDRTAANLPEAAESCFSITDHLRLVDARLARLRAIEPRSDEDLAAGCQLTIIAEHWRELADAVLLAADAAGLSAARVLEPRQRCLSPSDFGFHNALLAMDGTIRFIDFEYAGWDDPAKMTGDFFSQLAVPVPGDLFDRFAMAALAVFPRSEELIVRARLLRPVYLVKWCCIALNVFLPVHLARRQFADPGLDVVALKRSQLGKAEILFKSLDPINHGLY